MFSNEHLKGTICSQKNIVLSIQIHKNEKQNLLTPTTEVALSNFVRTLRKLLTKKVTATLKLEANPKYRVRFLHPYDFDY
jgi:hypothetical protein